MQLVKDAVRSQCADRHGEAVIATGNRVFIDVAFE
jgi:hypothetical protein